LGRVGEGEEGEKEEATHFVVREKTGEEPKGKRGSCACERGLVLVVTARSVVEEMRGFC
jgi:hypothetical protein